MLKVAIGGVANLDVPLLVGVGDDTAKYWLQPVSLARFQGFRGHELREIQALVVVHQQTFLDAWHEFFGR